MSYHNGSVWPHDNAIAAAGLKRYGFDAATNRIAGGLFDVASGARDFRLPELFCGFQRGGSSAIVSRGSPVCAQLGGGARRSGLRTRAPRRSRSSRSPAEPRLRFCWRGPRSRGF